MDPAALREQGILKSEEHDSAKVILDKASVLEKQLNAPVREYDSVKEKVRAGSIRAVASDWLESHISQKATMTIEEIEANSIKAAETLLSDKDALSALGASIQIRSIDQREEMGKHGIFKDSKKAASDSLAFNLQKDALSRKMTARSDITELKEKNIIFKDDGKSKELEKSLHSSMLNRALSGRTDKAELEERGIIKDPMHVYVVLEEEKFNICEKLQKFMLVRPTSDVLHQRGILEEDELAIVFKKLVGEEEELTLGALLGYMAAMEVRVPDGFREKFSIADQNQDGNISFNEFLELINAANISFEEDESNDEKTQEGSSVKFALLENLRRRSNYDDLVSRSILRESGSPAAALLERNLIKNRLKLNLAERSSPEELSRRGLLTEDTHPEDARQRRGSSASILEATLNSRPDAARMKDIGMIKNPLEQKLNAASLGRKLQMRGNAADLRKRGILIESAEHSYTTLVGGMTSVVKGIKFPTSELLKMEMVSEANRALEAQEMKEKFPPKPSVNDVLAELSEDDDDGDE
uniref:EF-hand domain-containing protein n=1 Tax=Octactis speculum TaxID=3111310 RepID=A0A7S2BRC9_9STRA